MNFLVGYRSFLLQFIDKESSEKNSDNKTIRYIERIEDAIVNIRCRLDT